MELSPLTDKLDMDNVLWLDLQQKILSIVLFGLNYRYRNIQNVQTNMSNDMGQTAPRYLKILKHTFWRSFSTAKKVIPELVETLPDVSLIFPVLQHSLVHLLPPGRYLHLSGAVEAAGPVLEWDTGVAKVGVLECEHFKTGSFFRSWGGTIGTQLKIKNLLAKLSTKLERIYMVFQKNVHTPQLIPTGWGHFFGDTG